MGFFSSNRTPSEDDEYTRLNRFMLDIGTATDDIVREIFVGGLAAIRHQRRMEAREMDCKDPGYIQEINAIRVHRGLPPFSI